MEVANTISVAVEKLSNFYDGEALELRFPEGKPTNEQGQAIGRALKAALQLQRMLLGPVGSIMSLSVSFYGCEHQYPNHNLNQIKPISVSCPSPHSRSQI